MLVKINWLLHDDGGNNDNARGTRRSAPENKGETGDRLFLNRWNRRSVYISSATTSENLIAFESVSMQFKLGRVPPSVGLVGDVGEKKMRAEAAVGWGLDASVMPGILMVDGT